MKSILLLAWTLQQTFGSPLGYEVARPERRVRAARVSEAIVIDGALTEAAWSAAPVLSGFTQSEPLEGQPASEDTEVRILYDSENLYVGIFARDREPDKLIVNDIKKDFQRVQGDYVQFVLDTFHDRRNGYVFATNAAGARFDAQMGNEGREMNISWDGVWVVKARIVEQGWQAEVQIPFKTLKFRDEPVQTWGINVVRNIRRRNEESYWAPLPRIYNIERVSMAGTLEGLEGIKPGLNLKIKPYTVVNVAQTTNRSSTDPDVGFDVKYGLTSGLTWDFTYNTDFSQVEADEQQINLTRFSLFFPEKRDFFLENSGIFGFGSNEGRGPIGFNFLAFREGGSGASITGPGRQNAINNDLILFFSRTIGLSEDGQPIPINGGTRLTGRAGPFELGLINIDQRQHGSTPATNFTVGRLRRNVMANSDVGVIFVNKGQRGGGNYNRVFGADANFRLWENVYANAYWAKSFSPLTAGKGKDAATRISGGYKVDRWNIRLTYIDIPENFRDEVGFVPRTGIRKYSYYAALDVRPKRLRRYIRTFHLHDAFDYATGTDGRLDTRYFDHHLRINFQSGAGMEIGTNPTMERLAKPFKIQRGISIPPGSYSFDEYFISGNTDPSRVLSLNGRFGTGPFYDGHKRSYQAGTTVRANHKFSASFSYSANKIELHQGTFRANLLSTRVNHSFSTNVFLNALIQFNSDTQQWSSNVRFNIIHRPLSDLFIVYNERRDSITGARMDRAVIAKLTYMIAR